MKWVAVLFFCVILNSCIINSAIIPHNKKIRQLPEVPELDNLKKRCVHQLISTHGCEGGLRKLARQPRDLALFFELYVAHIKSYLATHVGTSVREARLDVLDTIIQTSAVKKRTDVIKVIIEQLFVNEFESSLCLLAGVGCTASCSILLRNGDNINRKNILGKTALMCAAQKGKNKTVEFLLQQNANPHSRNVCNKNAVELALDNRYPDIALIITLKQLEDAQKKLDSILND